MSEPLTYVAFGHSHIVALAKGAYALQARAGEQPATGSFHYLHDEGFMPEVQAGPDGPVLHPNMLCYRWAETSTTILSIAQASPRFDFVLGSAPDLALDRSAELIPESVLRETLRDWMGVKIDTMRAIRKATKVPVIQAEAPPPLPREQVPRCRRFFASVLLCFVCRGLNSA